jgi:hypothetical protein
VIRIPGRVLLRMLIEMMRGVSCSTIVVVSRRPKPTGNNEATVARDDREPSLGAGVGRLVLRRDRMSDQISCVWCLVRLARQGVGSRMTVESRVGG